jgi:hypothetical protein
MGIMLINIYTILLYYSTQNHNCCWSFLFTACLLFTHGFTVVGVFPKAVTFCLLLFFWVESKKALKIWLHGFNSLILGWTQFVKCDESQISWNYKMKNSGLWSLEWLTFWATKYFSQWWFQLHLFVQPAVGKSLFKKTEIENQS